MSPVWFLATNQHAILVPGQTPATRRDLGYDPAIYVGPWPRASNTSGSWPRTSNPRWPLTAHQQFALARGQEPAIRCWSLARNHRPILFPGPEAGNPTLFTHFPCCAEAGMNRPGCIQQCGTMGFLILPPALATASPSQHTTGTIEGKGCRDLTFDRATTKSGTRRRPKKKFLGSGSGKK